MGFIKRKNKKFDYKPRYYKGEGNPYEIGHKLDKFRTTVGGNKGIKGKVLAAVDDLKSSDSSVEYAGQSYNLNNTEGKSNKLIIFIILILVLAFLFIIDFDLSIFLSK
jgi:hypothetical protein